MGIFQKTAAGGLPSTTRERRLKKRRLWIYGLTAAVGVILAGFVIRVNQYVPASGYVTAEHYAEVRSPVVGLVSNILVQSDTRVTQGAMLVQLSSAEEQAFLKQARSQVQKAEAELKQCETQIKDLSMEEKDLTALRQELESRQDAAARVEAAVRAREIRAPIAGQVFRHEFVLGELVRPETLLYEIFGGEKQILKLRIVERHAQRVAVGNRYDAWLASYRGLQRVRFRGEIQHLRNAIQSDGQTTYRVAFCSFDPQNHAVPPGATAEARIYCGKTCFWFFLFGLD